MYKFSSVSALDTKCRKLEVLVQIFLFCKLRPTTAKRLFCTLVLFYDRTNCVVILFFALVAPDVVSRWILFSENSLSIIAIGLKKLLQEEGKKGCLQD